MWVVLSYEEDDDAKSWDVLSMSMLTASLLRECRKTWMTERLEQHAYTDSSLGAIIVWLAAGGLWLADLADSQDLSQETRRATS